MVHLPTVLCVDCVFPELVTAGPLLHAGAQDSNGERKVLGERSKLSTEANGITHVIGYKNILNHSRALA